MEANGRPFIRNFLSIHIGGSKFSETIIIRTFRHIDKLVILLVEAKLVGVCDHNVLFIHIDGGKFEIWP